MPTMSDVKHTSHYTMFKGEPGVRKSSQSITYPKPIYIFDFDGKMNALTVPMKQFGAKPADVHYDTYNDWTSARAKLELFQVSCPYRTIVIDSITSAADCMLREVMGNKKSLKKKGGAAAGKQIAGISVNEMEDFMAESASLTELIALTKDIRRHHDLDMIIIAHVVRTEQKDISGTSNVTRVIVTAGKKPAAKLPAFCDEIYHFDFAESMDPDKAGDLTILTANTAEDYARTTLALPPLVTIGNKNLYADIIAPAISRMNKP